MPNAIAPAPWRALLICLVTGLLVGCGAPGSGSDGSQAPGAPPPIPEGAETVIFEREADRPDATAPEDGVPGDGVGDGASDDAQGDRPTYWGIAPGEPLPIMWEDLMPIGAMEDLIREQEEYLQMIQQRYSAQATPLSQADPFADIEEGSVLDYMPQLGNFETVDDLDGELVRIPGYVVPFDFSPRQRHGTFLFVPYMGACLHTPPPPPNQIIFVKASPALRIKDIWIPYWAEGTLSAEQTLNDLGDAAYALDLTSLEPYPMIGAQ